MSWYIDVSNSVWAIDCERLSDFSLKVPRNEWSPGIWAGAEGCMLSIGGDVFTVLSTDLENRIVRVNQRLPHNLEKFEVKPYIEPKGN